MQSYKERIDGYTLSLMNHQLATTETDIRWLNDLIQAEQRQVRRARAPRAARTQRIPRSSRQTAPPVASSAPTTEKERA